MATIRNFRNGNSNIFRIHRGVATLLAAGLLAALPFAVPARADLVVSFSDPGNVTAGSSGNSFDVLLTNTGSSGVALGVFTFEVATTSSDITFTDVTTATAANPYIFGADSLFSPDILGATTGQDITAFDLDGAGDVTIAAASTVGLGHVLFNVSGGASSGTVDLQLVSTGTSLSTSGAAPVTIQTLTPAVIQTTASTTVPEPSGLGLLSACLLLGWRVRQRRRMV